ncbi:aminotransferase class I/II-fold pyridoxal phosphate-dependent enzyme [Shewanella marina]|uniref:aminotransferase class I/II-fold pyridoxal phosphate-dependent enzyme n=1 Tax=Shewanella marina TaxID=487319 RepID=UPI000470AEA7|nr:8-amino-7-oxononanoate synthase [Shewanella marina]
MTALVTRIANKQQWLREQGLLRERKVTHIQQGSNQVQQLQQTLLNFSGNDYLGLSQHPEVIKAYIKGVQQYGTGSGASPLVTGYSPAHQILEQQLLDLTGFEAGLLFCSGFSANHALMTTLFETDDHLLADKLIHASLIDGVLASGAKLSRYKHNDIEHAKLLCVKQAPSAIITESVFSMDGDIAPLAELSALAKAQQALFIVDDAHGMGVIGSQGFGASQLANVDILVVTFGKALGGQGAAILASQAVIDFLVANARHYIYSTALAPAAAIGVAKSLELLQREQISPQLLRRNIDYFKQQAQARGLVLINSKTAIQPLVIGDNERLLRVDSALKSQGLLVGAIRPPTVPQGSARLRITLTAKHELAEIAYLLDALKEILNEM